MLGLTTRSETKGKLSSTLGLIGKRCPACGNELSILDNPPVVFPDDLGELDWDYVKNLALVPKVLAVCLRCGFVAVDCLTVAEARKIYSSEKA